MALLAAAFLITALIYASVGFGGGSTYNALLALSGVDFRLLPLLALACNIVVVSGNCVRFARAGTLPWCSALPLCAIGAPAAFLGGMVPIGEQAFFWVLGCALVLAGVALAVPSRAGVRETPGRLSGLVLPATVPLGFLAGLVGIGGGIFLAPLMHLVHWRPARQIAATASLFILVNSLFGLTGQLTRRGIDASGEALAIGWPLLLAVAIGGQLGSYLSLRVVPSYVIRLLTAALTLWVGVRLLSG